MLFCYVHGSPFTVGFVSVSGKFEPLEDYHKEVTALKVTSYLNRRSSQINTAQNAKDWIDQAPFAPVK